MNINEIIDKLSYYGPGATFAGIELAQVRNMLSDQQTQIVELKTECNRLYRIIELNGRLIQEMQEK